MHADQEEIARLFRAYGFSAIPVVDDFQRLRGVVTADDVLDIVEEEATEDMQRMVGLSGEEIRRDSMDALGSQSPAVALLQSGTAFLAGWVVSLFESTIAKYAVLAVFLPIIAGQGGNAGTQTLTIIVRSIALGELPEKHHRAILMKEILVGLLNGLAIGLVVGGVSWLWKNDFILGVITFAAMVLNMIAAGVAGVVIPFGIKGPAYRPGPRFCYHADDSYRCRRIFSLPRTRRRSFFTYFPSRADRSSVYKSDHAGCYIYGVKKFAGLYWSDDGRGSAVAGPAFITMPPAITPVARPIQAPGPVRAPADLNQAAMSQIINQLNQRQFQLSVAAAQSCGSTSYFCASDNLLKRAK